MSNIPNWPDLQHLWGAPYGSNGGQPVGFNGNEYVGQNVNLVDRALSAVTIKVGKQYELDTAQAGELSTTLRNDDAALDPTNTTGPYAGHVLPYQPYSILANYPASLNKLTPFQARSGQGWSNGAIPSGYQVYTATDPNGTGSIVTQAAAPGSKAFSFAVSSGIGQDNLIMGLVNVPAKPGDQYTFQTNVMNMTSGYAAPVQIMCGFFGTPFSYGPASWQYGPVVNLTYNTWYNLSATITVPSGAAGMVVGVATGATITTAFTAEFYNSMVSEGNTVPTYVDPSANRFPMFSGWVERWPSKWKDQGQYGTISATVVDAMALLSQGQMSDPLTEEIQYAGSRFLFRMDDPSTSNSASEAYGRFNAAPIGQSGGGASSFTFGNSITATNTTTGIFTAGGVSPSVALVTPVGGSPGTAVVNNPTTYLNLSAVGITGPAGAGASPVTRMIAFRWTGGAEVSTTNTYALWGSTDGDANSFTMGLSYTSSTAGALVLYMGAGGDQWTFSGVPNPFDGNWHLATVGVDTSGNITVSLDGAVQTSTGGSIPSDLKYDTIGMDLSQPYPANPSQYFFWPFMGNLAYAAEFPSLLSSTEISNLYSAWKNACTGESATARYARVLRYAGYTGPTNLGLGVQTKSMGPATDMQGSDALTCLENVVTTENGTHWVGPDGTLNFQGRGARYNPVVPQYTFGENAAAGEWPYEGLELDFDTTHLANDATVTNNNGGQNYYAINSASQTAYFDRTITRTINVTNGQEAQDAANFLVWRYSQPLTRVTSITLNPAAQANLWPVCLALDVGMGITINRRPPGCPTISLPVWIEQKQWTLDDKGNAKLVLQCSPQITTPMAQFTTWRTTLKSSAASGQAVITVAPPTQDTVNPLNAYIYAGMQLTLDKGTSLAETLTVKSVQATGSNWTSGTITFTTNLANTHGTGAGVNEQYASGQTSAAQFDSNSKFDDVAFSY